MILGIEEQGEPLGAGYPAAYWMRGDDDERVIQDPASPFRISQIDDSGPNGYAVLETNLSQQPYYDGIVNGKTVPRFTGNLDRLNGAYQLFPPDEDYTIIFCAESDLSFDQRFLSQRDGANTLWDIYAATNGRIVCYDGTTNLIAPIGAILANTPFICSLVLTLNRADSYFRVNGATVASGQTYSPTGKGGNFQIGVLGAGGTSLVGRYPELFLATGEIPIHAIEARERYLNNKYAIY